MLKVWGRRNSQNVQKVLCFVGELGLPYEHVPAGGAFGRLSDPDFRALNPNGLVPVIQDGDTTIWESHSILRYLAAEYGGERYWAKSAANRSYQDRWMDWCQAHWDPAFVSGIFWGLYRTPEKDRDWMWIEKSLQRCGELTSIVEHQLAGREFLTGECLDMELRLISGQRNGEMSDSIKPASIADLGTVERIVHDAYVKYTERIGRPPGPMLDDYAARISEGTVWAIEDGSIIVGILVLLPKADHLLLDNIAVAPAHQGLSFGRRLLEFAEAEAMRQGYQEIRLYTYETMAENRRLYAAIGYEETERRREAGYERVFMAKRLSPLHSHD